jgi:hypothetical protein
MTAFRYASLLAVALLVCVSRPTFAVPSFAVQTGQQCEACHIGAFGPQLTQFGRQFKLNGYTLSDGDNHFPPLAAMALTSFTNTKTDQPGGASPGFKGNDNVALDQASLFYAGRLFDDHTGAFIQTTFDGVANAFHWDQMDIRYANSLSLGGTSLIYGATLNNNPTVQDLWNSTPGWGFPFAASPLAPTPAAGTLIDNGLAQEVVGLGGYASWNDLLYVEFDAYRGLSADAMGKLGITSSSPPNTLHGFSPYWRIALEHSFGNHYLEVGTFGINAQVFPGGIKRFGADRITDFAVDATYQYNPAPEYNLSAYATYIRENQALHSSQFVAGSQPSDDLRTLRANVSFSYKNTYTLNAQHFETFGSSDAALYGTANGSPNSAGWVGEVDYVPSGKLGSYLPSWLNVKLQLQYVAYTQFDGSEQGASDNNTFYSLLWFAVPLN